MNAQALSFAHFVAQTLLWPFLLALVASAFFWPEREGVPSLRVPAILFAAISCEVWLAVWLLTGGPL